MRGGVGGGGWGREGQKKAKSGVTKETGIVMGMLGKKN
jgi:hypothetical protein